MNRIDVKIFSTLQLKLGISQLVYEGEKLTVECLLNWVQEQIDLRGRGVNIRQELLFTDGGVKPGSMILVEGRNIIHTGGIKTVVAGGTVSIFPPSGGG